jgi:L-serine dehydratase
MSILFSEFKEWKEYCEEKGVKLFEPVLEYEKDQKGKDADFVWENLQKAYDVMRDAVKTGLEEDMTSRSGMINNGAKKVYQNPLTVLDPNFQKLIKKAVFNK